MKSPFLVFEEFASPLMCEELVDLVNFNVPNTDNQGNFVHTPKTSDASEALLFDWLQQALPMIEHHYGVQYRGMERIHFDWFPIGTSAAHKADNSSFVKGKWLRISPRDFSIVLFLSDYQDKPPFDEEFEVYGGKLEFPQHRFSFNPKRGTLLVFPSDPHFIHCISRVFAGDLYMARTFITCQQPFIYDPKLYPGDFSTWFKG